MDLNFDVFSLSPFSTSLRTTVFGFIFIKDSSLQQYAEIPDLVSGETKSIPCITLQKHAGGYKKKRQQTNHSI